MPNSKDRFFIPRQPLSNTEKPNIWQMVHLQKFRWAGFKAQWGGLFIKRLFDIGVSATALTLLLPLFLTIALLICLESRGPIFFNQIRVGKQGKLFKMWKFRSMYADAEQRKVTLIKFNEMADGVLFKMKNDPRITQVGKYLRKLSLDELPQLCNVLIGDMSLVGPRPPLPNEVAKYTPYQRQRLEVTPGITCIWQVSGRSEIPFPQQVEMDLQYIAHQSFWGDIILLLKTVPAVLKGRGAY
jgi:exopolysaccharide biosynthesis polyprenyl glycosylphosphotransferase